MKSIDTLLSELHLPTPGPASQLVMRTRWHKEIEQILAEVKTWRRAVVLPDRDGLRLLVGGVALGYLRWDGQLDLPFRADVADRLVADAMATPAPDQSGSQRLVCVVRSAADVERAIWLLRLSYLLCCGDLETQAASKIA